ncbi:unnamed protein product [Linum trigynum]|uniref:Uncharacterized protein n=1 Tax=Linum trigynum TaxID=586398 RepID=A0AAV2CY96_9ROSI
MMAFTGQSAEPCYSPQQDPNCELRLLIEHFVRDTEISFLRMDLLIQSIYESEEAVQRSVKQTKWVEQVCAQLAQHRLSASTQEEQDEEGYKDIVEYTEVVTVSRRAPVMNMIRNVLLWPTTPSHIPHRALKRWA